MADYSFKDYRAAVFERLDNDKDFFQLNVGEPGAGKSTFAFQLAWNLDPTFNADRMLYSGSRFVEVSSQLDAYPAGSAFVIDEAVIGAWRRSWNSKENNDLSKYVMVFRERNFITQLNMPYLLDVDEPLKRRSHWLSEVQEVLDGGEESRARALLFKKNRVRQFSKKPPGFTKKLEFDFYPIKQDSPMWAEWRRYQRLKRESVAKFTSGMDTKATTANRVRTLEPKARSILMEDGVRVVA